jgi:pimeloyl-ACP methyl ester carboxylesterase
MTSSIPTLSHPLLINGKSHIPPPSISSFNSEFTGILPKGTSIPSSWGTTRYYDFSPSSPPTSRRVILLHGNGSGAISMAPLALALTAAGNHVVAYDMWGNGLSSSPLTAHTPALAHFQLLELLSHLKWETANLIGMLLGGSTVATFTAIHLSAVESLIVLAPGGLWRMSEMPWYERVLFNGGWGREWLLRKAIIGYINRPNTEPQPSWKETLKEGKVDITAVNNFNQKNHAGHFASVVSASVYGGVMDQHELFGQLPTSGVEVLVVLGEKDTIIDAKSTKRELEKLKWKGEIETIAGAEHSLARVNAEEVAGLVIKFWDGLKS